MSCLRLLASTLVLTLILTPLAHAQIGSMGSASVQTEVLMGEHDLTTIDGTLEALYGVISFEKGGRQDWDGFDKLFVDGAILSQLSGNDYHRMTPAEYKANFKSNRSSGKIVAFQEEELHRETDRFGSMAQVFSTYQSNLTLDSGPATARGINTIQLVKKDDRWWIVSILWTSETSDNKIPSEYLSGS